MTTLPIDHSPVYNPSDGQLVYYLCKNDSHYLDMGQQLLHFGYSLMVYTGTDKLLTALQHQRPTALICEQASENSSIAQSLNSPAFVGIPLVIIATDGQFAMRLKAVRAGCSAFFTYPVDVPSLVETLDSFAPQENVPPPRILIVEDTRTQANLYALLLNKSGMQTRILIEPADILTPLADFNPDLILLDMYMPACNGMELARIIRHIDRYVSIPIVYLSAETDRDKQIAAIAFGDDFLTKPIRPDHLTAVNYRTGGALP